jgi:phytoene synthase
VIQPQVELSHCEVDSPQSRVEMLAERLDEIYEDRLELPAPDARSPQQHALFAFAQTIRRVEVPKQYFIDFAEGRRLDLMMMRYATWDQLDQHCQRSGGIVATILAGVLGLTHSDAFAQAATLGKALRLTQVLRDVKQDLADGRVYLPQDEMSRFGYREKDLTDGVVDESFRALMRFQIERARQFYRDGAEAICWLAGDGSRMAGATVAVLGGAVLHKVERNRYDVFSRRAELTTAQRLRRLPAAWRLARRDAGQLLPNTF